MYQHTRYNNKILPFLLYYYIIYRKHSSTSIHQHHIKRKLFSSSSYILHILTKKKPLSMYVYQIIIMIVYERANKPQKNIVSYITCLFILLIIIYV